MDLLKDLVAQAKIKKIQIDAFLLEKLIVYQKKKEQKQLKKKKVAAKKGQTVVPNTPKAKVKLKNGGEVRRIARGCGKVMSNRRKKTKYS
jgi:hypothetical protein